ncbi:hypothetical protein DH09_00345 (plasmid) [Bacillaceae bacterium JMAK1]|nr:hypothetical protein DH09_00345 [Bacillaceae bacterium JMAK1]
MTLEEAIDAIESRQAVRSKSGNVYCYDAQGQLRKNGAPASFGSISVFDGVDNWERVNLPMMHFTPEDVSK